MFASICRVVPRALPLLFVIATSIPANAVTITFKEDLDEGVTHTTLDVSDCSGCIQLVELGGAENGQAGFLAPAHFFAVPLGQTSLKAFLVEPAGIGEVAGSISDTLSLSIFNGDNNGIRVDVDFASGSDNGATFPPAGFPTFVETGKLQNVSGFFALPTEPFTPRGLPSNLTIFVESSVIPEPSSGLLLGAGLFALAAVACRRYRRSRTIA